MIKEAIHRQAGWLVAAKLGGPAFSQEHHSSPHQARTENTATPYSLLPLNPGLWEHGGAHSFSENKNPLDFLQPESHD